MGRPTPFLSWVLRAGGPLALALVGCGEDPASAGPTAAGEVTAGSEDTAGRVAAVREQARGANVLLITLDTLRADRVGCYGHAGARTPTLDRLAREGVLVERALATVPLTLPSHASILTGQNPTRHGVRDNTLFVAGPELVTLAEGFRQRGYRTAAFVSTFVLAQRYGLDQGFDHYDGKAEDFGGGLDHAMRRGAQTVNLALRWMESEPAPPEPWFVWLHLYDPHRPWEAPEPFASEIPDPYDAEIAYTDKQVGRLLRRFDVDGRLDRTLVLVTSDHGEGVDEHREATHGMFVYDSTMRVPLILRYPPLGQDKRLKGQVSIIDLAPTCADLFELAGMDEVDGRSFLPALVQDQPEVWHDAYLESLFPTISYGLAPLSAVSTRDLKYVEAPRPELYDWREDPAELRNLFLERPEDVDRLSELLKELQGNVGTSFEPTIELTEEAREKLEALGYVQGGGSEDMRGADPKDFVELAEAEAFALGAVQEGRHEEAVRICDQIVRQHPGSSLAWAYKGQALLGLRLWAEAVEANQMAHDLRPDRPRPLLNLAIAYTGAGRPEDALSTYELLRKLHPAVLEGYLNAAEILKNHGEFDVAGALLEQARAHTVKDQQLEEIGRRVRELEAARAASGNH